MKLSKTGWGRSTYTKFENLTVYLWLMKVLLAKKFNVRKKIQNLMFKDSIEIFQGLIEFIEGLIVRKIDF